MKKDFVSLAEARPDLAKEWNYEKNGDLRPEDVSCGSGKKVWWVQYDKSPISGEMMKLEWEAPVYIRAKGIDNPFKAGKLVFIGYNDLKSGYPALANEWDYERNQGLKPDMVTYGSNKKVWWIQYDKSPVTGKIMKLEWKASIASRVAGSGNPIKSGQQVLKNYNDLASLRPDLAAEWNYERNGDLKPDMVSCGSGKKVWWVQYDKNHVTNEIVKLEWESCICNRIHGTENPFKCGKEILEGYNDLASLRPDLAAEWNYEKNGTLTPNLVSKGYKKSVWWIQYDKSPITGEIMRLEWKDTISHRIYGRGNPITAGKQILKGYNDLASLRPDLAAEWNYERNGDLKPDMIACGCNKKVWWVQYDKSPVTCKTMKLEWEASVASRVSGSGNPFKHGNIVLKNYNDLKSLYPQIAGEWNFERNGKLKPDMVTYGSNKKVWWIQYDKSPVTGKIMKLEWIASINNRTRKNAGCPIKAGLQLLEGYNDLASVRPDLAAEWNYERNVGVKPNMVICGSDKKVWWVQYVKNQETGEQIKYEWKAPINRRLQGSGNPYIITYKGEEYIKQYLEKNNISFNVQQRFSDLRGTGDGQLSYDFSIPDEKFGCILIEYNGIQHYEANDFFGGEEQLKKQKEHDKRKRDYAKKHGYKLITVKYTYDTYESVEEYLDKELKKLGVINDTKKEENVNDAA